jgi:hypothetical protein
MQGVPQVVVLAGLLVTHEQSGAVGYRTIIYSTASAAIVSENVHPLPANVGCRTRLSSRVMSL